MLNLLRSDLTADASTEAIARALAALTPSDLVRLKRLAQLRARQLPGLEWDDPEPAPELKEQRLDRPPPHRPGWRE
jgi:hypothetical protein